ncbi:MAG: non-canonical purine NTP pyrophosphatase, partial [Deltaproteobacteria bacterium]|nr:non-canonical purine NTP pyrophosphatase [Deltaproteobacteria bacterium]
MEVLTIVVATRNDGKLAELRELLGGMGAYLVGAVAAELPEPEGAADTLEAAAIGKAREATARTGLVAVAEETGLEVDALGGRPGVRSAHFAHDRATDAENNAALLRALEEVDEANRGARFRTVLALSSPWSEEVLVEVGSSEGVIARAARGGAGFGYQPLFVDALSAARGNGEFEPPSRRVVTSRA